MIITYNTLEEAENKSRELYYSNSQLDILLQAANTDEFMYEIIQHPVDNNFTLYINDNTGIVYELQTSGWI